VSPLIGLIARDANWFIMLPVTLSSLLLAVLALEFAWRYPALILSPLLFIIPQVVTLRLSKDELFFVELPWEPANNWVSLHFLVAFAGVLVAIFLDRRRERLRKQTDEFEKKLEATTTR
jgi:membrane protein implicated in regulation of membrane protease activity